MKAVMRKALFVFCVAFACGSAFASLQYKVANVEAQQRYPWNGKVDIDFAIESEDATADFKVTFECKDLDGNTNIVMKTIRDDDKGDVATAFTLKAGTYRFTWDADADVPNVKLPNISIAVFANYLAPTETVEYLVIDLSGGTNATSFAVSTLAGVPSGGWTDEYKTTKLVLRRCPAGADPLGRYTLTKDFYAGVFEVTQKQWELVMGEKMVENEYSQKYGLGDAYPVYYVSYDAIRGLFAGANWPSSSSVDSISFIGRLRTKTGLSELDLPTEAQWEYACRAGTTTLYYVGDEENAWTNAAWCAQNSSIKVHVVGLKVANAWGLYDMHGNVLEWCLDWYGGSLTGNDPVGAASNVDRCLKGGSFKLWPEFARSSSRRCDGPSVGGSPYVDTCYGFRIFRTLP